MSLLKSRKYARGIYLLGLMLSGLGGWLTIRTIWLLVELMIGHTPPTGVQFTLMCRGIGGAALIVFGFTAMTLMTSYSFPQGRAVDFEAESHSGYEEEFRAAHTGQHGENRQPDESLPVSPFETFGPPRPHILIRCSSCRTLNEQSQHDCVRCGKSIS